MDDKAIIRHLSNAIEEAPIDLLNKIKQQPKAKMLKHDEITRQDKKSMPNRLFFAMASMAAIFLFAFFNYQFQYRIPDSVVFIDVNPSIKLVTNRKEQIIGLEALNQDAQSIISNLEYKGLDVDLITQKILNRLIEKGYLNNKNDVILVSVYNKDELRSQKLQQHLKNDIYSFFEISENAPVIITQIIKRSDVNNEQPDEDEISEGKRVLINKILMLNDNLSMDVLKSKSIQELIIYAKDLDIDMSQMIHDADLQKIYESITSENERDDDGDNKNSNNGDDDDISDDEGVNDSDDSGNKNNDEVDESNDNENSNSDDGRDVIDKEDEEMSDIENDHSENEDDEVYDKNDDSQDNSTDIETDNHKDDADLSKPSGSDDTNSVKPAIKPETYADDNNNEADESDDGNADDDADRENSSGNSSNDTENEIDSNNENDTESTEN